MKDIADHIFDILENSVRAGATEVQVVLSFNQKRFFCEITDNGRGITGNEVTDPFVTSRKERRVGLGLPLLKRAAESTGGFLKISNLKGGGTCLEFEINLAHIDAKPFGDIAKTFIDALYCWPEVRFSVFLREGKERKLAIFDSKKIREIVNNSEIKQKEVRDFIYNSLAQELKKIGIDFQFGVSLS